MESVLLMSNEILASLGNSFVYYVVCLQVAIVWLVSEIILNIREVRDV